MIDLSKQLDFDINAVDTPYYAVDENKLIKNLKILKSVKQATGCKILLAQKCFSMYSTYALLSSYLDGTTASGLYEAKLGKEYFKGETHIFSPYYADGEFSQVLEACDHLVFNSAAQWLKFKTLAKGAGKQCGLRINPEFSTQEHGIYDPCTIGSRFGVRADDLTDEIVDGLDGLHFHTLCEQGAEPLAQTVEVVEEKFGKYFHKLKWLNFGGGHHITKDGYNLDLLVKTINRIKQKYGVQVYLEPGEAVALDAGYLVATVGDIVHNGMDIAILDTSASCHMPDVIEMPYRPIVVGSSLAGDKKHTYRFSCHTCLAGDVIGDYSFDERLKIGDKVAFLDMAIYSMVKNNTFNGMRLPSIVLVKVDRLLDVIKTFGYDDFKARLS